MPIPLLIPLVIAAAGAIGFGTGAITNNATTPPTVITNTGPTTIGTPQDNSSMFTVKNGVIAAGVLLAGFWAYKKFRR